MIQLFKKSIKQGYDAVFFLLKLSKKIISFLCSSIL